jgi:hypothetical protein
MSLRMIRHCFQRNSGISPIASIRRAGDIKYLRVNTPGIRQGTVTEIGFSGLPGRKRWSPDSWQEITWI